MQQWLATDYTAIMFEQHTMPVAYALFRPEAASIYLRQFFVERQYRRHGIGRRAIPLLLTEVWPPGRRITLDVLVHNQRGRAFWHALGFQDYAVTLELLRQGTIPTRRYTCLEETMTTFNRALPDTVNDDDDL
jgi:GNAT superfamily N-acetyltransferase